MLNRRRVAGWLSCRLLFPALCFEIKRTEGLRSRAWRSSVTTDLMDQWRVVISLATGRRQGFTKTGQSRLPCESLTETTVPQLLHRTVLPPDCLVGAKCEEDTLSLKQKRNKEKCQLLWSLTNRGQKASFYSTVPYKLRELSSCHD